MADSSYNFFQSPDLGVAVNQGLGIVGGIFQGEREKKQQQFELALQDLKNRKDLNAAEYAVQLEGLKQKYAVIQNDSKDEARDDWRQVIFVVVGAVVLIGLVFFLQRK